MPSEAATLEEYIAEAPVSRRGALNLLANLCREELRGFEVEIKYGMPSCSREDAVEVAFVSQKNYPSSSSFARRRSTQSPRDRAWPGCGSARVHSPPPPPELVDPTTMRALLGATVADAGALC
jgi:hypothetical protein